MLSDSDLRSAQIKAIHVAKRQLRLDDETYRAIVKRVSGKFGHPVESSAQMNPRERGALLDELRNYGFRRVEKVEEKAPSSSDMRTSQTRTRLLGSASAPPSAATPQTKFIRTMWGRLHDREKFRDSEKALRGFCKRITGRDSVNWLTAADANKLIEAIKARLQRPAGAERGTSE